MAQTIQDTNKLVEQNSSESYQLKKNCTIFVGDLDLDLKEEQIIPFFSKFGSIKSINLKKNILDNKSKGFCFLVYSTEEQAQKAIKEANGAQLGQKVIRVAQFQNPKENNLEANLFLNKIDKSLQNQEIQDYFSKFGNIKSLQVNRDSNGASLGYGYIQFDSVEVADKVVKQTIHEISNKQVEISRYLTKDSRENTQEKRHLYISQIPSDGSLNQTQVEEKLRQEFSKFGEIQSLKVEQDKKQRFYSFITLPNEVSAAKAIEELHQKNIFNSQEPISVVYPQTRDERIKQDLIKCQLYSKNLLVTVTEQQVRDAFSVFGQIDIVTVTESQAYKNQAQSRCAFITFQNPEDAEKAQILACSTPNVKKLYNNQVVFAQLAQSKQERDSYLQNQKKNKQPQFMQQNPMQMPMNMNMNMMMGPTMFMPPQNIPFQKFHSQGPRKQYFNKNNYNNNQQQNLPYKKHHSHGQNNRHQNHNQPRKYNNNQNQNNQTQQRPKPNQQSQEVNKMEQYIKRLENLAELGDQEKQQVWKELGTNMYPKVKAIVGEQKASRITGMLVDLQTYTIREIVETLYDPLQITQQVKEANELIEQEKQKSQN